MRLMESYLGWTVDFAQPAGAHAFAGPDSVSWRIFKNPVALTVGGVAAVLLEFAEPRIRSGVWDYSTFKSDPIGRSQRTGMAAMISVYGPEAVARRMIQGVTNMHARVEGSTPAGERYRALDPGLLDWVSATANYGFLTAYDRFVAPLDETERSRFYAEAAPISQLYGVATPLRSDEDFFAMMERLAPHFEPHPIVRDFLHVWETGPGMFGIPSIARRAAARAAVSILPPLVRERLELGAAYDLSPLSAATLRTIGAAAERIPILDAPPAQACRRLGLPADFLYKSRATQARLLTNWAPAASAVTPE